MLRTGKTSAISAKTAGNFLASRYTSPTSFHDLAAETRRTWRTAFSVSDHQPIRSTACWPGCPVTPLPTIIPLR